MVLSQLCNIINNQETFIIRQCLFILLFWFDLQVNCNQWYCITVALGCLLSKHGNCLQKCKFAWQWNWLSAEKESSLQGKEIGSTKKKKKGSTGFSSALNNHKTYGARSLAAIAFLGCVILNTVTCCYSRGLATGLNTVILTHFCSVFQLRRSECYESSESEFSGRGARFCLVVLSVHVRNQNNALFLDTVLLYL